MYIRYDLTSFSNGDYDDNDNRADNGGDGGYGLT